MALDKPDRIASARTISESQRYTLLAYSERMASLAVRERSQELIVLGLIALAVAGCEVGDWRDSIVVIAPNYDAALRLKADPGVLFEKAAALLPDDSAEELRAYLRRPAHDKTLEVMGYVPDADAGGFRYRRTW